MFCGPISWHEGRKDPLCCRLDATGFGRGRAPRDRPQPRIQSEWWQLPISGLGLLAVPTAMSTSGLRATVRPLEAGSRSGVSEKRYSTVRFLPSIQPWFRSPSSNASAALIAGLAAAVTYGKKPSRRGVPLRPRTPWRNEQRRSSRYELPPLHSILISLRRRVQSIRSRWSSHSLRFRIFDAVAYLCPMPKSPFEPCIPTTAAKVPDRPEWIHEIKHDGYRLIVQRDGKRIRTLGRSIFGPLFLDPL